MGYANGRLREDARFNRPKGIAWDERDNTICGDANNYRIRYYRQDVPGLGAITDINGEYTIKVEHNRLVFSYIGYKTQKY